MRTLDDMKRKAYNPRKFSQQNARKKMNDHVMVFIQGIPTTLTFNRKTKILANKIDPQIADEATNSRYKWNVTMAVLQLNQYGSEEIVWYELSVDSPVLQQDIAETLTLSHAAILGDEDCKDKKFLRFAWVACPSDNVLNDDEMFSIFKRLRGFQEEIFTKELIQ